MRLLKLDNDSEVSLTEDFDDYIPPYAILSHTWGASTEEPTFGDMINRTGKSKSGYNKIRFCGEEARRDGLQYFLVDTCCIDKSNLVELSEAINSMFRWYLNAAKCYVYLSDVSIPAFETNDIPDWKSAFRTSRWFTRAWTLQELIAPISVEFFSREGKRLGNKRCLERNIHEITGIPVKALRGSPLSDFSLTERMSWSERRQTKRKEDMAYSLLGIFNVYMPLIYGEGRENAFRRLPQEIDSSSRFGHSTATVTAQDPTSLTQRAARHNDAIVHVINIAEPSHESPLHEEPTVLIRYCLGCNILFCLWILLAVLSLAVGLWRSFKTSDEGKGFTDAAYVVAVGGLIIFPVQTRHAYTCKRKRGQSEVSE